MRGRIASKAVPGTRLLDPTVLTRIGNLELVARTVVEGFISGLHSSPFLGLSLDFAAHRPYMPGDDIRKVDWRVFARTDRFYVKEYEAETNANVFFALDISRSMDYGSGEVTKLEYARFMTACLAYLSAGQRDRVGAATFDSGLVDHVFPSVRNRRLVLAALDRARAERAGDLLDPLRKIGESLRRKGLVVLVSDLYARPPAVLSAVAALKSKGHDVIVFHVLDPAELRFPFETPRSFEDLETGERIPITPDEMGEEYLEQVEAHTSELARLMAQNRIDYELFDTSEPLDGALYRYLSLRERRLKGRS
jgi:uncharacterized protein (DUF58 family)